MSVTRKTVQFTFMEEDDAANFIKECLKDVNPMLVVEYAHGIKPIQIKGKNYWEYNDLVKWVRNLHPEIEIPPLQIHDGAMIQSSCGDLFDYAKMNSIAQTAFQNYGGYAVLSMPFGIEPVTTESGMVGWPERTVNDWLLTLDHRAAKLFKAISGTAPKS